MNSEVGCASRTRMRTGRACATRTLRKGLLAAAALLLSSHAAAFDHAYPGYAALLTANVHWTVDGHSSVVNYATLKQQRVALDSELKKLSAIQQSEFDGWSRPQQMAFLINAYNAGTLALILTKYPDLKSIRDLGSLLRSPWKQPFVQLFGEPRTLDWIEHEQLRAKFPDSRIHFVVNCASIGCPALRPEPFVADRLEAQLDDQQQRFLTDRSRNRFDAAGGELELSSIFKWYGGDFKVQDKGLEAWLAARAESLADKPADRARIARGDFKLDYLDYDWRLNERTVSK